jgi:hypothetical protein
MWRGTPLLVVGVVVASCNGTTGDQLITFSAYASGAPDAAQPFSAGGFTIQLTTAKMHLGALYFDEAPPGTGFNGPVCIASGVYAAQVPGPLEVDLLSSRAQEFSVYGSGTADIAQSWQIWLTDGDVNEVNFAHMVDLEGVATGSDGTQYSFGAAITINEQNRVPVASDPSQPGESPVCKQRIIQLGGLDIPFFEGGALYVQIDPRAWFNSGVDFSALPPVTDPSCLDEDPSAPMSPEDYAFKPDTAPAATETCGGSAQPCCAPTAASTTATCLGSLSCSNGICGPTYCIPNSSFAEAGGDLTAAGAQAGANLFAGVQTGGPAAYSVRYSKEQ